MTILCSVNLPYISNIPRDVAINTFVIDGETEGNTPGIIDALTDYYTATAPGATESLDFYLSAIIAEENCHIEVASIDLPTGDLTPVADVAMPIAASTNSASFPLEVALCQSIQAGPDFGAVSVRRRRGRHYIGPFHVGVAATGTTTIPRPSTQLVEDMAFAANQLMTSLEANGTPWCVWSRAEAAVFEVDRGWVDFAWDTQRRREVDTILRQPWPIIVP